MSAYVPECVWLSRSEPSMMQTFEPDSLVRIEELLREVRELSLLGDTDRRDRLLHHLDQRKRAMSRQIMDLINLHEFAKAERILFDLESQFDLCYTASHVAW